nr:hypothetical protein [candidate division Zixibacteria bacterium]
MFRVRSPYSAVIIIFAIAFVIHALSLSFTQDDAFISYRYVKNFLNGDGLVFNMGERVEGYTNFFLIILMALFGRIGLDYIIVSKVIGIMSGLSIFGLILFKGREFIPDDRSRLIPIAAAWLLLANGAMAYWSISGLETVFFSALVFYGVWMASARSFLFIPFLALATLTRPEGGLIFLLVMIYYLISGSYRIGHLALMAAVFAVLILPQFVFRWFYYGDLLPNPFYAKTGWSSEYLASGLSYIRLFLKNYGFGGGLIVIPMVLFRFIPQRLKLFLPVIIGFIIYVGLVGGDVLHGYRFFIVLLPILYIPFTSAIYFLVDKITKGKSPVRAVVFAVVMIACGAATFLIPRPGLLRVREFEIGLVSSMKRQAEIIGQARSYHYTIALTTIGAYGFYSGAEVIDMLGLTDRTIAKNPRPVWGIKSTWKERNYNVPYLMEREPDLILFSTGLKPSAPAEKALFLSSKFRNGYYPVFHVEGYMYTIFKHRDDYRGPDSYYSDPGFINLYAEALNYNRDKEFDLAFEAAGQSARSGPPDFYLPVVLMGDIMLEKGELERGLNYLQQAFEMSDGHASTAGDKLGRYYEMIGDTATADIYYNAIMKVNRL